MPTQRLTREELSGIELPSFIVVEGPIGSGKTTLSKMLAATLNCDLLLEDAEANPFLNRFYAGEKNAALATQLFFLMQRTQQLNALHQSDLFSPQRVADFLIEKDRLFAEVTLDADELALYNQVYQHLTLDVPKPDLVIYLQATPTVLLERIHQRGIPAEQSIRIDYLQQLNEAYSRFFHYYNNSALLIINVTDFDWVNNISDYNNLVRYLLSIHSGRHYYNPQPGI